MQFAHQMHIVDYDGLLRLARTIKNSPLKRGQLPFLDKQTTTLVLRFTKTLTNKIEGFIFQFRRKPQRYP
jgi:hypothetical protein